MGGVRKKARAAYHRFLLNSHEKRERSAMPMNQPRARP